MHLLQAILTPEEKQVINTLYKSSSIEQASQKTGIKQYQFMAILIGIRIKLELTDYDFTMFVVQLYQITQEQGYEELKQ